MSGHPIGDTGLDEQVPDLHGGEGNSCRDLCKQHTVLVTFSKEFVNSSRRVRRQSS